MPARRQDEEQPRSRRLPARTIEAEEDRIIDKAARLAERQIDEGTVSSQVLSHYLKLGSSREKLEQRRIRGEIKLNEIKAETIASEKRMEELAAEAIRVMTEEYRPSRRLPGDDYDD